MRKIREPEVRAFGLVVAGIVLLGFAFRATYIFAVAPSDLAPDALWYFFVSGTVAHGHGYVDPGPFFSKGLSLPTATFPPLWPLTLAAARKLGINSQQGLQFVGAVLGSVTVYLTALVGRRVAGDRVGIVAALLVACSPLMMASDGSLMSESLYVAIVTGAVLLAYATIANPTWARFAGLAALAGAAALARGEGLVVGAAIVGVTLWRARLDHRSLLKFAGVAVATFLVVLAPWFVRNFARFDRVVPLSTNSGSLVEGANCGSTYSGPLLGAWDYACLVETSRSASDPAISDKALRRGVRYAVDHPVRLPLVAATRVMRGWGLWDPVNQAQQEGIETRNEDWQVFGWGYGLIVSCIAIGGAVVLVRRRATIAPLVAVVVAVTATIVLSWGNQRFRLAAEPAVAVFAAAALVHLFRRRVSSDSGNSGDAPDSNGETQTPAQPTEASAADVS
jgi:hypothetical protein